MEGFNVALATLFAVLIFWLLFKLQLKIIVNLLTAAACLVIVYLILTYLPVEEWLSSLDFGLQTLAALRS